MSGQKSTSPEAESLCPSGVSRSTGLSVPARSAVYGAFFLSGATALTFEILWSRQFVPIFGNSSYAISAVLCAFMAGLGVGNWAGGVLADRVRRRLLLFAGIETGIAAWALLMPWLLAGLRRYVPRTSLLVSDSLAVTSATRFVFSLAILLIPCALMGMTLPCLSRFATESGKVLGKRVGLLYGLNTVGAALGCLAAGYLLLDALGTAATNYIAVGINLVVAAAIALLQIRISRGARPAAKEPVAAAPAPPGVPRTLLLGLAFLGGLAGLACEVLWLRYMYFVTSVAYSFTNILAIFLLGLGAGSLLYRLLLSETKRPLRALGVVEILLGLSVPVCFAAGAKLYSSWYLSRGPLLATKMALLTIFLPTVFMGMAFPLLCAAYGPRLSKVGRTVGAIAGLNTAGSIVGSLLPIFVLLPLLGVQNSLLLLASMYLVVGSLVLAVSVRQGRLRRVGVVGASALVVILMLTCFPAGLCRQVFLATSPELGAHTEIAFWKEGRTATSVVVRDKVDGLKNLYINGTEEVPMHFPGMSAHKMLGTLGPLLHPNPDRVFLICFGGGITAGTVVQHPEVKSLEVVDLETTVFEAAGLLEEANNRVLSNPKVTTAVADGRNYALRRSKKWPVIIADSTHPKGTDSWVLYTREFYRLMQRHLSEDGVFVQWLPMVDLSVSEFKIILRTLQSVFPHTSVWLTCGADSTAGVRGDTFLVATPEPLQINLEQLREKLAAPAVAKDLRPYGLDRPAEVLNCLLAAGDGLRAWVGGGPINTDDLPLTYYETRYSRGTQCRLPQLAELMQGVGSYLTHAGPPDRYAELKRKLERYRKGKKRFMTGDLRSAFELLPESPRFQQFSRNLQRSVGYVRRVTRYYQDHPLLLAWWAQRVMNYPAGDRLAMELYRRLVKLRPRDVGARNNLALLLHRRGRTKEAARQLRTVVRNGKATAQTYNNLGLFLASLGENEEAYANYRRALGKDPEFADAHYNLGALAERRGNLQAAVDHYRAAVRYDPTSVQALVRLSQALMAKGEHFVAAQYLHKAVGLSPHSATLHYGLGVALLRQGHAEAAIASLQRALRIAPEREAVKQKLAQARALVEKHASSGPETSPPLNPGAGPGESSEAP